LEWNVAGLLDRGTTPCLLPSFGGSQPTRIPAETTDGKGELLGKIDSQRRHAAHLKAHANAFAERWIRSVREECLSKLILFGERSLKLTLTEFVDHYHGERNHQGKGNLLLFPQRGNAVGNVECKERIGGLLKYYARAG
jgi:hypothetical protein